MTKSERSRGRRPLLLCAVVRMFYSAGLRSALFRLLEDPACGRSGDQDYEAVAQENKPKRDLICLTFYILNRARKT